MAIHLTSKGRDLQRMIVDEHDSKMKIGMFGEEYDHKPRVFSSNRGTMRKTFLDTLVEPDEDVYIRCVKTPMGLVEIPLTDISERDKSPFPVRSIKFTQTINFHEVGQ
jgi:hypothetical protein